MGKCLPRTSGHVGATELSGELVKVIGCAVPSFVEHELERVTIAFSFGKLGNGSGDGIP